MFAHVFYFTLVPMKYCFLFIVKLSIKLLSVHYIFFHITFNSLVSDIILVFCHLALFYCFTAILYQTFTQWLI
jgi:hypothetical protein